MNSWDIDKLRNRPQYNVIDDGQDCQSVVFANEPFHGKPTEVFAYIGIPEVVSPEQPVPGMVCVHGGGGKAFREWVELWVERGYAAIAMDLGGIGGDGQPLAKAGPAQDYEAKFSTELAWKDLWTYHAVAAVIRANSLLSSFASVDKNRIGVTGISWGGYLTCIVAGLDDRFSCAIPVYGCGFLQDNSADEWLEAFARMTPERKKWWYEHCEPAVYLPKAEIPMLFITGTNDFAYPLDSLKKSCSLPKGAVTLSIKLEMPHGHVEGWTPPESAMFADAVLRRETPLPKFGALRIDGEKISALITSSSKIAKAFLLYSCDSGKWQERKWHQVEAGFDNNIVYAGLPDNATLVLLAVEDENGAYVSSVHEERSYEL